MTAPVLVTGATGTTGSVLTRWLILAGVPVRVASRTPPRDVDGEVVRFDWYDEATFEAAYRGVRRMYLLPPIGDPDPASVVRRFLEPALRQGLRRVVLLSSSAVDPSDEGLGALQTLVRDLVPEWVVLRPSWFMQNFTGELPPAEGIRRGQVVTATGGGAVGFISADDIAAVAGELLRAPGPVTGDFVLTGPEALTFSEVCALAAELRGAPVEVTDVSAEQLVEMMTGAGIPEPFAQVLAELDLVIASGAEARVTDTVERLTGRPPVSMRAVLARAYA